MRKGEEDQVRIQLCHFPWEPRQSLNLSEPLTCFTLPPRCPRTEEKDKWKYA